MLLYLKFSTPFLLSTCRGVRFFALSILILGAFFATETVEAAQISADSKATVFLDGKKTSPSFGTVAGFWLFAKDESPQVALMGHPADQAVVVLEPKQRVRFDIPLTAMKGKSVSGDVDVEVSVRLTGINEDARSLAVKIESETNDSKKKEKTVDFALKKDVSESVSLTGSMPRRITIELVAAGKPVAVRIEPLLCIKGQTVQPISLDPVRKVKNRKPVESSPPLQPAIESALIEWDWRMQDGIGTPRESVSYPAAIKAMLRRGDLLVDDLVDQELLSDKDEAVAAWRLFRKKYETLKAEKSPTDPAWETLWRETHRAKRKLAIENPLFDKGPLLFCKRVPSIMSHQLTQYYGYAARPGGGLFVLEQPGMSMRVRCLSESLPAGSYLRPEVAYDGKTIYFPFCPVTEAPSKWRDPKAFGRRYHLYSMKADGSGVRQLTQGDFDDIQPVVLPGGDLIFSSTRRGGFHRCGSGPCYVYTLATVAADGSDPQVISFHETNEWDPTVLNDGRVVYTRWDYVDRHATYYQQLWSVRQDGSDVRIFYGNNTWNPVGIWGVRPVPDSNKVMATAGAHHAMSAGSIILLDTTLGVDGARPLRRLTSDALFPESEAPLAHSGTGSRVPEFDEKVTRTWALADRSEDRQTELPIEQQRWSGHCYRSPWPFSENYFLAAYSYDRLRGEATANIPNMFGLYLVDAFGNRELLYRDPNLSSQWPIPLAARQVPPQTPTVSGVAVKSSTSATGSGMTQSTSNAKINPDRQKKETGIFALQNVYESWPKPLGDKVTHLRIIQVLPKTTPNIDDPPVGQAKGAPAKQILGTVPVEEDGSALFEVPARTPVLFQALDAKGRAIQTMRSLTYLQPGEKSSCVGCHESRMSPPLPMSNRKAFARAPSKIKPGPVGSKPFSYPILVQPILDRHCVECHNRKKPEGKVVLTADPEGHYTKSYNSLVPHITYSAWMMPNENYEPLTLPGRFGSQASRLVKLLDEGHYDVKLSAKEWERLVTWIDANGLFYGTFNKKDQARQKKGLDIKGPELE